MSRLPSDVNYWHEQLKLKFYGGGFYLPNTPEEKAEYLKTLENGIKSHLSWKL